MWAIARSGRDEASQGASAEAADTQAGLARRLKSPSMRSSTSSYLRDSATSLRQPPLTAPALALVLALALALALVLALALALVCSDLQ